MHFVVGTAFLVFNNKKSFKDIDKFAGIVASALLIGVALDLVQKFFFPTADIWAVHTLNMIKEFFTGAQHNDNFKFIEGFSFSGLWNVILYTFGLSFFASSFTWVYSVPNVRWNIGYDNYSVFGYFLFILFALVFIYAIVNIVRKKKIMFALPFIITLLGQMIVHTMYGNDTLLLYSPHSTFLTLIIIAIGIGCEDNSTMKKVWAGVLSLLLFAMIIVNLIGVAGLIQIWVVEFLHNERSSISVMAAYFDVLWRVIVFAIVVGVIAYLSHLGIKKTNLKERLRRFVKK